jgi:hypothetical protein
MEPSHDAVPAAAGGATLSPRINTYYQQQQQIEEHTRINHRDVSPLSRSTLIKHSPISTPGVAQSTSPNITLQKPALTTVKKVMDNGTNYMMPRHNQNMTVDNGNLKNQRSYSPYVHEAHGYRPPIP